MNRNQRKRRLKAARAQQEETRDRNNILKFARDSAEQVSLEKTIRADKVVHMPRRQGLLGKLSGVAAASIAAAAVFLGCSDPWIPTPTDKIFYTTDIDGDQEIYRMNDDGSFQVPIVVSPSSTESYSAISPDGTQVAYTSNTDGNLNIYVAKTDGTGTPVQVTDNAADESHATWLSDTEVAYTSTRNPSTDIFSRSSSGTGLETQVTSNADNEMFPSKCGTKVVYARYDGLNWHIWSKNSDGIGTPTKLTAAAIDHTTPAVSPDESTIALAATVGGTDHEICTMPSTGGPLTQLTTNLVTDGRPTWRPDGLELAYESNETGQYKVFTMSSTDGSNRTMVSDTGTHNDGQPAYSPVPTLD